MILFPAIDLYGGKVVRLTKGDFAAQTVYDEDPVELAKRFRDEGFTHLHVVDLEGAKDGRPHHLNELSKLSAIGLYTQYGGGLRTEQAVRSALDAGANRVMVGSLLFKSQDMPAALRDEFGEAVIPAVDVKGCVVVHGGWLEATDLYASACLDYLVLAGYRAFLVTAVEKDGMLSGPDFELYKSLASHTGCIVAAGGVSTAEDIARLREIGLGGAVIGKTIYEGGLSLRDALAAAGE